MPRYYEDAARLLLAVVTNGVALRPDSDHRSLLHSIALLLERFIAERPTHAEAARHLMDQLPSTRHVAFDPVRLPRLIAIAGTLIGNLMTTERPRAKS